MCTRTKNESFMKCMCNNLFLRCIILYKNVRYSTAIWPFDWSSNIFHPQAFMWNSSASCNLHIIAVERTGSLYPCLYPTQVGGLRQLPLYLRLLGFWVNTLQPAASFLLFMTTKNNRRGLWLRLSLALNARIRIARFKLWTYTTRALREQMFLIIILFTNILKGSAGVAVIICLLAFLVSIGIMISHESS